MLHVPSETGALFVLGVYDRDRIPLARTEIVRLLTAHDVQKRDTLDARQRGQRGMAISTAGIAILLIAVLFARNNFYSRMVNCVR